MWIVMVFVTNFYTQLLSFGFPPDSERFSQDANPYASLHLSMECVPLFVANLILGWILIQIAAKLLSKQFIDLIDWGNSDERAGNYKPGQTLR